MEFDLTKCTEAELVELHRRVVERVKAMRDERRRSTIAKFSLGDRVSFRPECGHEVIGTVVRRNKKSVTIMTAEGTQWRVAPVLLSHVPEERAPTGEQVDQVQTDPIDLVAPQRCVQRTS